MAEVNYHFSTPRFLLLILGVAYWAVGFYPFDWFSPFAVHQNIVGTTAEGGLSFRERGIAYTETAPNWIETAIKDNAFEVELEVRPYDVRPADPARIFTVSHDQHNRNFTIDQYGEHLVARLRTRATGSDGLPPEYVIPEVFRDQALRRIIVQVKPNGIRIEVNGRQRLVAPLPSDALSTWEPSYRLALGNEFTFQEPRRGEIRMALVRVRDEELSYAAREFTGA